jgi:hypothetical protein
MIRQTTQSLAARRREASWPLQCSNSGANSGATFQSATLAQSATLTGPASKQLQTIDLTEALAGWQRSPAQLARPRNRDFDAHQGPLCAYPRICAHSRRVVRIPLWRKSLQQFSSQCR